MAVRAHAPDWTHRTRRVEVDLDFATRSRDRAGVYQLLEAEGLRSQSRSPEDLGAWDMVIKANSLFWRLNQAENETAMAILRQAV